MSRWIICLCLARVAAAQSFEVASIKPVTLGGAIDRMGPFGGPGTKNPELFRCENCSAAMMIHIAFKLGVHELRGPEWANDTYFTVTAKVPKNTKREQLNVMFRNLLIERFQLKFHFEKKERRGYALRVASGGPKMKEAPKDPIDLDGPPPEFKIGADGYPELPPGRRPAMLMNGRRAVLRCAMESMEALASELSGYAGQPVMDATGLKGVYDFVLRWAPIADPGAATDREFGPTIFKALQDQLGLKLEPRKILVDVLVVDHLSKNPEGN